MEKKIAVIGAGNLGLSLAKGLVESKTYKPNQFNLSRRRIEKLKNMAQDGYNIYNDNVEAIKNANIVASCSSSKNK